MSTVKVWGLGDAVVDLLPEKPGTLLQCHGGAPANVAVGVARLGGLSGFVGCVGDDPFGRFMRKSEERGKIRPVSLPASAYLRIATVPAAANASSAC